jgi:hypothetical protein
MKHNDESGMAQSTDFDSKFAQKRVSGSNKFKPKSQGGKKDQGKNLNLSSANVKEYDINENEDGKPMLSARKKNL